MDKPQLLSLDPANLEAELQGPVMRALVDQGWTVATSMILDDPRRPEHDRLRVGLVMMPPHPSRGGAGLSPREARLALWLLGAGVAGIWLGVLWAVWALL